MLTLEAEDLTRRFGGVSALEGATFRLEGPTVVGYLGPNGAGKTTTLKLFTRLLRPSRGVARINGIEVTARPKEALWDVGAVIESPDPYPQQTSEEALTMVAEFRGLSPERTRDQIRKYAELLDLPPLDRRTGRLSKGQRQRVVLAATLLAEPRILLLDEPTSGLDPAERVRIRRLLATLKRDRLVLMSSHLLPEVTETCDRVLFVSGGRILLEDTIAGVAARYRVTQIDVEFVEPVAPDRWSRLGSLVSQANQVGPRQYRLTFNGDEAVRAEIYEKCLELGRPLSFAGASLSLEDAYLQLLAGPATPASRPLPPPPPGPSP